MGYIGTKPSAVPLTSADITDGIITSAKIADGTIVNADINATSAITLNKLSGNPNFRNRIINGDMSISQRHGTSSVTQNDNIYSVDRFGFYASQSSKLTVQQNAGSVTPPQGFKNYLGYTSSSAYTVSASEVFVSVQPIEGYNVADLDFGTANAKSITLSFWVRSSLTGTFGGALRNADATRSYPFTYSISSANTWEKKSIIFQGDTSGTWNTTNGYGLGLMFGLGVGSTVSSTAGSWQSGAYYSATGATSVVGTSGATWYITGVQLEAGTSATDFEFLPIDVSLGRCQRYFIKYSNAADPYTFFATGMGGSSNTANMSFHHPVRMRAAPTLSISGIVTDDGFASNAVTAASNYLTVDGGGHAFTSSAVGQGRGVIIRANGNAADNIQFNSEL